MRALRARVGTAIVRFSYLPRALRLIWEAAPKWTVTWGIILALQGLLPAATVYLTKPLVDSLTVVFESGGAWENLRPAFMLVVLMVGIMVVSEMLRGAGDLVRAAQSDLIQDYIASLLQRKSMTVDLAFYESPTYYDRLEQARGEASSRPRALLDNIGSLSQNMITLIAMATVLLPYGLWVPVLLVISTLPAFLMVLRFDRRYHEWWKRTTVERRRAHYYQDLLMADVPAAEVRLFGLGPYFHEAYQALRARLRHERLSLLRSQTLVRLGAGAMAVLSAGAAMGWMVWRAGYGRITLGDLALFYQAFNSGQNLMRSLLGSAGQTYNNMRFLENLFEFLDMEPQIKDPPHPITAPTALTHGITLRDVTFRYPGSERPALQHFNLTIPAGKIVAIVGTNGAGKTTLVKLLCRFYDPDAGRVELDGIDIKALEVEELRRRITVLFQFPVPYQGTAAENITYGDIYREVTRVEIEGAARSAGAHELIAGLPQGYETQLGKWFMDGAEFSGGEWQRVATARAYVRQAPIIILDEPTSAMDSWSEADWFDRLRNLARGKTGLIITHRFTVAMRADIIHVMDQGRLLESGTHHELLALGGRYAESWSAQMEATGSLATTVAGELD